MSFIMLIVIAISLSMDAFSLSLAYGTLNITSNRIKLLSIIVSIYHFFMPLLGLNIGKVVINLLPIKPTTLVAIVLFLIGIEMIIETFKENKDIKRLNLFDMLIFGLAVSIDSFTLGLGLKVIYDNIFVASFIFMIFSFLFTYTGLILGKKINESIGKISTIFGGITLIIVGIFYLL